MPTVAFHTLGCKVNFYDTEGIWQVFKHRGYEQVPFEEKADVYVVNTCTVTHTGDKKSRQMIRRAVRTNPDAVVVVTGCYAQVAPDEVARIAGVDLVIGNDQKSKIVDHVERVQKEQHPYQSVGNIMKADAFEELDVPYFEERSRANLKIQDGCNNFCTFCIIPRARGLIRSRKPENVLAQATKLAQAGYREIVLTGIHTGGYGADFEDYRLAHLLADLERIELPFRIRISSIEASEIDDHLIEVLGRSQKVVNHLHIPLQAGSDEVLRRMHRHYTVAEYAEKLKQLRKALPDLAITSDVIVGFPGETDADFENTYAFVAKQRFSQLHVFPYSQRRGTAAAKFKDQVAEDVKHLRVTRMIQLSQRLEADYARQFVGRHLDVIAESPVISADDETRRAFAAHPEQKRMLVGYAGNYLRVAFRVPEGMPLEALVGERMRVRIVETGNGVQLGHFVEQLTFSDQDEHDVAVSTGGRLTS
ncbi:threonylcarbamoyladenosine tRNA methylthiotransferase MtaB [Alicyclobacillus hesperidum subsp. aegles]|uniref:tRNA (N(6)-L-threonylcarbamoyladenosine(37)-C(2))- methylthiotransferase MtaB n=1 Tax=Alicyclobacillus hesperidum TaxID=89784 RepID=UPI0007193282|nr:tRNA (N(6)-L-threonylcarbamoyladenosine(37)-C(2))-methylthiotransferase MtaB [Alicyclobacillus hesperidum]KRW91702.1 30S ribosomal protein S12 methylthiotransferase [Alicyclobacillus tengchongensis]GLG00308.1 threonylcarbamoyladenosine tRNA methylthiotransferase MtaB [Alicyclobacillus hesperidum subsp. aegles]